MSGRQYRIDQQMRSAASGKTGHQQEYRRTNPRGRPQRGHCSYGGAKRLTPDGKQTVSHARGPLLADMSEDGCINQGDQNRNDNYEGEGGEVSHRLWIAPKELLVGFPCEGLSSRPSV
jgi:hypothetical protein